MTKTYLSEADWINGILLRPVDFEVPDLGWVQVRGLSSLELDDLRTNFRDKPILMMLGAVEKCLVQPKLSPEGVKAMHNGSPGPVEAISARILELSGQGKRDEQDPLVGDGLSTGQPAGR